MSTKSFNWPGLKSIVNSKKLTLQYVEIENQYNVFSCDGSILYECYIYHTDPGNGFNWAAEEAYLIEFETLYKASCNKLLEARSSSGVPTFIASKNDDFRVTLISHDWTDKTSWYEGSVYVEDEIATDSGDHLTYNLAYPFVVDTYHGNITDEDYLKDSSNRSFRVTVKVNNTTKTEQDPHYGTGGDYTINYVEGKIVFLSALDPADEVKVTYHYASSSIFTVKPAAGKVLSLDIAEVQLSVDVVPKDTCRFQLYGYVQSFAPQLTPTPYPANTLIPLGNPTLYKGIRDFINGSLRAYPKYQAVGGAGWRGLSQDVVVYDWDYVSKIVLDGTKGMEIRVTLDHNTAWDGAYGTVTFYGTQK